MLDKPKLTRFRELRKREAERVIVPAERDELGSLIEEMDLLEMAALQPALERMEREHRDLASRNRAFQELQVRKSALAERLRMTIESARAEQQLINEAVARIQNQGEFTETLTPA